MAQDKSIFYNSDYIVIEYRDLLKSPEFTLLQFIQKVIQNEKLYNTYPLRDYIRSFEIDDLSLDSLAEWYINRKYQNLFKSLFIDENMMSDEEFEKLIVEQINMSADYINLAVPLPLMAGLMDMKKLRMVEYILSI